MNRTLCALGAIALACGCVDNPTAGIPVFLWHSVGQGINDKYDVPADEFARELDAIAAAGATPVSLAQVFDASEGRADLPQCPVVITFDDGRQNMLTQALPLLQQRGMLAEGFVVTGRLGESEATRFVEHTPNGDYPYLLWSEVQRMANSGVFVIESHTVNHPRLSRVSVARQRRELVDSQRALRERLDVPCDFVAYPFGAFDDDTVGETVRLYRGGVAVGPLVSARFSIKRISIHRGDLDRVSSAVARCR